MRQGKRVRIFDNEQEAEQAGCDLQEDLEVVLHYSVQEISDIDDEWERIKELNKQ